MKKSEIKRIFEEAICAEEDPTKAAQLEVLREYFTNKNFKEKLQNYSFEKTQEVAT